MDKIKRAFGGKEEDEGSIITENSPLTQISDASSLSWSTRIKCFGVCFVIGVVCSVLATIILMLPGRNKIKMFAVLFTFGNIVSLSGTCFLMGPMKQLKNMFKEKRLIATIVMLISFVLTLCAAFWWKKNVLAFIFCIIQYLAMTWYCLSYIPFARFNCAANTAHQTTFGELEPRSFWRKFGAVTKELLKQKHTL